MYLGWYDPDRKTPTLTKLIAAIDRYAEKFDELPACCLCHPREATELNAALPASSYAIEVHGVSYIPHHTFYVGEQDAEEHEP